MLYFSFLSIEEKSVTADSAATEQLLLRRSESGDEWSLDDDLNTRRESQND